jgi:eukaryotic-like serine/threonine-protein kinase
MKRAHAAIGRYQVRERLAQGGMGVLYLALDPAIDRLVALKVLRVNNSDLRERFLREARLAARLQHPNIVTIFDVGQHEGQPFIAMEYIPGETLSELIHRRAPVGLTRKLAYVQELCQGLAYAHRHGIVHRDVKPANVMVSRDSGIVKVLDFGIARGGDSSLTQAGMLIGTPNYMSPEQVEGRPVDHRSDIFAVGLVLYEVLVYRQAFVGDSQAAVLHKVLHAAPEPLATLNADLDPALATIVDRAVAKSPDARYADLDAMRNDLARVVQRMEADRSGHTVVIKTPVADAPSPAGGSTDRAAQERARHVERRRARIVGHLQTAENALAGGALEDAQSEAELAAELDPDDPRVVTLLDRVHAAFAARELAGWIAEAKVALTNGDLTRAGQLVNQALASAPASADVQALHRDVERAVDERERTRARERAIERALDQARENLRDGGLDAALRATTEALGYGPDRADAITLRREIEAAIAARATAALGEAEREARVGHLTAAIRLLERLSPRGEEVEAALDRLRHELVERERRRREGEEAARRALEEWARAEVLAAQSAIEGRRWDDARASIGALRQRTTDHTPLEALEQLLARSLKQAQLEEERAQSLARSRQRLDAGDFPGALSLVDAALARDPMHAEGNTLRRQIDRAWAEAELERERLELQARADAEVLRAKSLGTEGLDEAIRLLEQFDPPHATVSAALVDLRAERDRRDRARRDEEERQARARLDARVESAITRARALVDEGRTEAGIDLLASFDPPDARVAEALTALRETIAAQQRAPRSALDAGEASRAIDVLHGVMARVPSSEAAAILLDEAIERQERLERESARRGQVTSLIEEARARAGEMDFAGALARLDAAIAIEPADPDAQALRQRVEYDRALEGRASEVHAARAADVVKVARAQFASGYHDAALRRLERFAPPHPLVDAARAELGGELEARARPERHAEAPPPRPGTLQPAEPRPARAPEKTQPDNTIGAPASVLVANLDKARDMARRFRANVSRSHAALYLGVAAAVLLTVIASAWWARSDDRPPVKVDGTTTEPRDSSSGEGQPTGSNSNGPHRDEPIPPPPSPVPGKPGSLAVDALPWALIERIERIDGDRTVSVAGSGDYTPAVFSLEVGQYRVTLEHRGNRRTQTVAVAEGASQRVHVVFDRLDASEFLRRTEP